MGREELTTLTLLTSKTAVLEATTTVPAATIALVGFTLNASGQSGRLNSSGRYVPWYTIKASALTPRMTMPKARESRVRARRVVSRRRKRRARREGGEMVSASKSEEEIWVLRWEVMMDGEWSTLFGVSKL